MLRYPAVYYDIYCTIWLIKVLTKFKKLEFDGNAKSQNYLFDDIIPFFLLNLRYKFLFKSLEYFLDEANFVVHFPAK